MLLALLWGLAEATFFFIVPDVFLSLVAILGGWRTWRHIVAAIFGALLGGALLFQWAKVNPGRAPASWQLVGVYAAVWMAVYGVYWGRILSG